MTGARCQLIYPLAVWITQLFSVYELIEYLLEFYRASDSRWMCALHAIVKFYLFVNFVVAALTDPGIIPPNRWPPHAIDRRRCRSDAPKAIKVQIGNDEVALKWCNVCRFHRPPRSVHCDACNYCIDQFDHHCWWLNHCVGRRNHRFFFAFIVLQTVDLMLSIGMHTQAIGDPENAFVAVTSSMWTGLLVLAMLPVLALTAFHSAILLRGQTTHEFVSNAEPKSIRNWSHVLCGALYPSLVNRR